MIMLKLLLVAFIVLLILIIARMALRERRRDLELQAVHELEKQSGIR